MRTTYVWTEEEHLRKLVDSIRASVLSEQARQDEKRAEELEEREKRERAERLVKRE